MPNLGLGNGDVEQGEIKVMGRKRKIALVKIDESSWRNLLDVSEDGSRS